jgi:hypothetical protein
LLARARWKDISPKRPTTRLVQPPGTDTAEPSGGTRANSTVLEFYHEGSIESPAYKKMSQVPQKATRSGFNPYPAPSPTATYGFSYHKVEHGALVDEKSAMIDDVLGRPGP